MLSDMYIMWRNCTYPMNYRYRHLIPAPVYRTFASIWLYKHLWIVFQKYNPSTSMTHIFCESKVYLVVKSFMQFTQHTKKIRRQLGVRSSITHLVQELNVGTVQIHNCSSILIDQPISTFHGAEILDFLFKCQMPEALREEKW